jgi:hypothetical protein
MYLSNTDSAACYCRCECGYLPKEDWNYCPFHGDWEHRCRHSVIEKIAGLVENAEQESELDRRQLGALNWALRKCREIAAPTKEPRLKIEEL